MQQPKFMKTFFRVLSVAMLPLTASFPAVGHANTNISTTCSCCTTQDVLVYWISSNMFSLGQLGLSRTRAVKNYFNIPEIVSCCGDCSSCIYRATACQDPG